MGKSRLEAFSDGVLAIIITIMVLELEVPHGTDLASLQPLLPRFLSYVLSFLYVGIYWNNHHHMLQAATRVSGGVLWANLSLLFWLSLFPFATGWMGENHFAAVPSAVYGFVLLMAAISYYLLQRRIIAVEGSGSVLRRAIGTDWKGKASPILYIVAMAAAFEIPWLAQLIYVAVALMWLVPDRRIERAIVVALPVLVLASGGCGPPAPRAVDAAVGMSGRWTVVDYRLGGIHAMSVEEAASWRGREVSYGRDLAHCGDDTCATPTYTNRVIPTGEFLREFAISPAALDLPAAAQVKLTEVSCRGVRWTAPGAILIWAGKDRAFTVWDGVYFELRPSARDDARD